MILAKAKKLAPREGAVDSCETGNYATYAGELERQFFGKSDRVEEDGNGRQNCHLNVHSTQMNIAAKSEGRGSSWWLKRRRLPNSVERSSRSTKKSTLSRKGLHARIRRQRDEQSMQGM